MSLPKRSVSRSTRSTLLLVGEGDTEIAFLGHLRSLYCKDNAGVKTTIRNAYGKEALHVINTTVGISRNIKYDCCVAVLDADTLRDKDKKLARTKKINLIVSTPCIEGLFLSILNKSIPDKSEDCKKLIWKLYPSFKPTEWTEKKIYSQIFPKEILEEARKRIPELDKLLKHLDIQPTP